MLRFPHAAPIHGDRLQAEIAAAGYQQVQVLAWPGGEIEVRATTSGGSPVDERSRAKIAGVLASHDPAAAPKPPALVRLERVQELRALGAARTPEQAAELLDLLSAEV